MNKFLGDEEIADRDFYSAKTDESILAITGKPGCGLKKILKFV